MLPETVAEMAAGHRVSAAVLFEFNFASSTQRFWDGVGWLAAAGHQWLGFGELVSVSGLQQSVGMTAPQATFTLTGAKAELLNVAANSASEVTGRRCAVYLQFLSSAGVPLDDPIALWVGKMDVLSFNAGATNQSITLTAETLFVKRVRSPYGYLTDTDQQARYPGDVGLEFMPKLLNKTVNWLRA